MRVELLLRAMNRLFIFRRHSEKGKIYTTMFYLRILIQLSFSQIYIFFSIIYMYNRHINGRNYNSCLIYYRHVGQRAVTRPVIFCIVCYTKVNQQFWFFVSFRQPARLVRVFHRDDIRWSSNVKSNFHLVLKDSHWPKQKNKIFLCISR